MAEPDENPFGDPNVGHPFQVNSNTLRVQLKNKKLTSDCPTSYNTPKPYNWLQSKLPLVEKLFTTPFNVKNSTIIID